SQLWNRLAVLLRPSDAEMIVETRRAKERDQVALRRFVDGCFVECRLRVLRDGHRIFPRGSLVLRDHQVNLGSRLRVRSLDRNGPIETAVSAFAHRTTIVSRQ